MKLIDALGMLLDRPGLTGLVGDWAQGLAAAIGNSTPMRLKVTASDFQVQEATDLRISRRPARYRVYLLEKEGWNTVDALLRIARAGGVPFARFAYGGKKDRHARTSQYVTVDHRADLTTESKGYRFRALGYSPEPMAPDRILYNRFVLTIRDLTPGETGGLLPGLERVGRQGFINYFDDQRFGSWDRERGFVAEAMLWGRWEEALSIALTAIYPEEAREAKARKRALREQWGNWPACLALARTGFEKAAFGQLAGGAGADPALCQAACRAALAAAPREQLAMWVAAYQSFLWNEWVRRLLAERGWACRQAPGRVAPYWFPCDLPPQATENLTGWLLPLPGRGMRIPDSGAARLLERLLAERGLERTALTGPGPVPGADFRAVPRPVLVLPASLTVQGPEADDRYPGREKVTVAFDLPRGSYATMLIKAAAAAGSGSPAGSRPTGEEGDR